MLEPYSASFKIGAILDVRARINPGMVQRETIVLVGVVLDRSTPDSFQAFEQAAGDLENVLECYLVAGEVDYFLKFVLKIWLLLTVFIVKNYCFTRGKTGKNIFVLNEVKTDGMLAF